MPGASTTWALLGRNDAQRTVGLCEHATTAFLHDNIVLDPDAAPAGDVDARFDREHHAILEHRVRTRIETRVLMRLETEAVADPVEELLAVTAALDHAPRSGVDIPRSDTGAHRGNRGVMSGEDQLVDIALLRRRFSDDRHPRRVRLVASERRAEVEQYEVARREAPARRLEVRQARVRSRLDQRREGQRS